MVAEPVNTQALKERRIIRKERRFESHASESFVTRPQRANRLIFRTKKFSATHDEAMLMLSMEAIEDEW